MTIMQNSTMSAPKYSVSFLSNEEFILHQTINYCSMLLLFRVDWETIDDYD